MPVYSVVSFSKNTDRVPTLNLCDSVHLFETLILKASEKPNIHRSIGASDS